ncbi:M2 family metallopeptidase [Pseudovibrio brasiliensis]|uniref:M2 family metallopeptidase n=1 Tax=Pseudovibrio brasiliensis TaxID=1898042 RepID=A0ABX8AMQ3_9HYPH|nr:M2 family metallopeptidase [Pseudovibrio brasiliensis]QUS55873.1 M2 family metallopeptidase [Pseudovibrio brasiliensis]
MKRFLSVLPALSLALIPLSAAQAEGEKAVTVEDAKAFIESSEIAIQEIGEEAGRIAWVNANFITYDTNWLNALMSERTTKLYVSLANQTKQFDGLDLPPDLARKMKLLKLNLTLPAPEKDPDKIKKLAQINTEMETIYGTGKYEIDGEELSLSKLSRIMATSRDYDKLLEVWKGWRTVSPPMKDMYADMVGIANQGSQELGFNDTGSMWRSKYDMDPDDFRQDVDRLWGEVKPLYDSLHCYVRGKLVDHYGADKVPADGPIPAHLLGNMWAQSWGNIYPLVAAEGDDQGYDLTKLLEEQNYTPLKMVQTAEGFFTSLGFDPLPETFYERSLITEPRDRDVQCHASAWNVDGKEDLRIKMCTEVTGEDFNTVHHELGHNFYQRAYNHQSPMYQDDPNDGFHEAIGDMVSLSITPKYLKQIGLLPLDASEEVNTNILMAQALDKIAFLPFGLLVDQWRWKVFNGELTPETYNDGWWELREKYQGVAAPVERAADAFDPGAKYHIPNNVPYTRYFLAHIFQFQFYREACRIAGWEGPLAACSIYGNKEVGKKFNAMLETGSALPWQDSLEAFTGSREADATAILEYFAPLKAYLDEQNKGKSCGW